MEDGTGCTGQNVSGDGLHRRHRRKYCTQACSSGSQHTVAWKASTPSKLRLRHCSDTSYCKKSLATCRDAQKLATVKQECENRSQGKGSLRTYTCDFSSLADIRLFADKVKAENKSIDVLINNAGIFAKERSLSKYGYELTWAVNTLAPVLLTSLLLDKVTERIVNVGSAAAADAIDLDNLQQVVHSWLATVHAFCTIKKATHVGRHCYAAGLSMFWTGACMLALRDLALMCIYFVCQPP